ncbi:glycoside hydrolase family 47 protein [Gonapodya prolifera JEL478]|uniref:alpha-1,2-Mannosidase n=1 Tax=Gonapodya prolifera (strain JEL478) TaxID=1344416 RepID=A0A139AXT0_GONPJ|nr:glycoside hydrolase family 47 protein [Gonapodya prolifera JEL478]|eukprot:KXS21552.1 glycoside hydrolase family 47 protein [Gonapodya prolifera JEL478]
MDQSPSERPLSSRKYHSQSSSSVNTFVDVEAKSDEAKRRDFGGRSGPLQRRFLLRISLLVIAIIVIWSIWTFFDWNMPTFRSRPINSSSQVVVVKNGPDPIRNHDSKFSYDKTATSSSSGTQFHPFQQREDPGPDHDALKVLQNMARHAWSGYYAHAKGCDELKPISQTCRNWTSDTTLMTPIDSLGTLWIMDLKTEFNQARDLVSAWNTNIPIRANFFETIIRVLGGLLSAYDLSGDTMFLDKAVDFASRAEKTFDPVTGLPGSRFDMRETSSEVERLARSGMKDDGGNADLYDPVLNPIRHPNKPYNGERLVLAEVGTFQLEMSYLADVTGDERWLRYVERCNEYLYKMSRIRTWSEVWDAERRWLRNSGMDANENFAERYEKPPDPNDIHPSSPQVRGLWTTYVTQGSHSVPSGKFTVGGAIDSFYEYLLKQWIYFGGDREPRSSYLREMYLESTDSILRYMAVSERVPGRWEASRPMLRVKDWPETRTVVRRKTVAKAPATVSRMKVNNDPVPNPGAPIQLGIDNDISPSVAGAPGARIKANLQRRAVFAEENSNGDEARLRLILSDGYAGSKQSDRDNSTIAPPRIDEFLGSQSDEFVRFAPQATSNGANPDSEIQKPTDMSKERNCPTCPVCRSCPPKPRPPTPFTYDQKQHFYQSPEFPLENNVGGTVHSYIAQVDFTGIMDHSVEHLACFVGGMFGLGVVTGAVSGETNRARHAAWAQSITETCAKSYFDSPTGLGPEVFEPQRYPITASYTGKDYNLRPETVESIFYMWRYTHDPKWRRMGWRILEALESWCRTESGYAAVLDVGVEFSKGQTIVRKDTMESFFVAETLKYLYLLFSGDDVISLDRYVFNTEAHPLTQRLHLGDRLKLRTRAPRTMPEKIFDTPPTYPPSAFFE